MRHAIYSLKEMDISHPKLEAVKEIVSDQLLQNPESRVIVFTNYRDTSELVTDRLKEVDIIRPVRFVGQASKYRDTGLTQKQQVDILNEFKSGKYVNLCFRCHRGVHWVMENLSYSWDKIRSIFSFNK